MSNQGGFERQICSIQKENIQLGVHVCACVGWLVEPYSRGCFWLFSGTDINRSQHTKHLCSDESLRTLASHSEASSVHFTDEDIELGEPVGLVKCLEERAEEKSH